MNDTAMCMICNVSFIKRYIADHYNSNTHNTNAFNIHKKIPNVELIEIAFGKRIFTCRMTSLIKELETLESFMYSIKNELVSVIHNSIKQLKVLKVDFILFADFIEPTKMQQILWNSKLLITV